jgi:hypothetical protein
VSQKKFAGPNKGLFPDIDDAVVKFFFSREKKDCDKLYCVVPMACRVALSFFQNPALDHKCNLHVILMHT